ncbi:MAG: carboxypeptidase-like regulatory domain-containing protein [Fuerstiella sp.]
MKRLRAFTPIFVLGMALCVTVGSIYVTVKAAAQPQDEAGDTLPPTTVETDAAPTADVADVNAAVPAVAAEPVTVVPASSEVTLEMAAAQSDRQHHIHLDASGGFDGRLSALIRPDGNLTPSADVQVQVISGSGKIASTVTDEDGAFSVSGLSPGVVAVVATGEDALLVFSVRLIGTPHGAPIPVKLENVLELDMNSAVISGVDLRAARQLIGGALPQTEMLLESSTTPAGSDSKTSGEKTVVLDHHPIVLRPDGTLAGYVIDPATEQRTTVNDLTLHFIREGAHVASTPVLPDGSFSIAGLAPGIYSLVSNGSDGVSAQAIHLIDAIALQQNSSKYKLASMVDPTVDLILTVSKLQDAGTQPPGGAGPVGAGGAVGGPGGGGTGSGGGGGGVGGGSGGLGALLGAAAGGALGYALGDDDDDIASPNR